MQIIEIVIDSLYVKINLLTCEVLDESVDLSHTKMEILSAIVFLLPFPAVFGNEILSAS